MIKRVVVLDYRNGKKELHSSRLERELFSRGRDEKEERNLKS